MQSMIPGALDGVRILDLSRILAGPSATQLLGDLGADVVKVEKPGEGDDTRKWGPPYVVGKDGRDTDESAYYLSANRNKRSIAIDIATEDGRELLHRLLARADVLVENYKVGGLARHGLDYPSLRQRYPGLVYCSVTGFGQTGPYARRAGYDFLIQGMGGIMSLTGETDGTPMKVGVGIADVMTGMYAAVGILAALRHRDATGEGQQIDISLLDSQIAWLVNAGTNYLASAEVPKRLANGHPNIVPYQVFETADGPMILAVGNDGQFRRFCEVAGIEAVARDERYGTNIARVRHREAVCEAVQAALRTRPRQYWLQSLEAVNVPCGPVNDLREVFEDPHVQERGAHLRMPCDWARDGAVSLLANPLKLSRTPVSYRRAPPRLNEHVDEILRDWGGGARA
ncbi:CaiB/BaiF CoA-transferase family protein [Achromobacter xylosoxidans]|uniref:CaiB/BaiF CoA transferase family protein n=1 Tax=Alcaligenes xylosoxydans xylosoxydans TaxID=85698 RepID=UPI0022B9334E|nr:CaiB/BaiF CoA-transferase family protein [Achromobacter xylosoxidans]MCZ8387426.1 CaiB/BaiF CoA-transferase family protein [Achromobacter xylosoxidans]